MKLDNRIMYKQWHNLCSLYPDLVDPNWIDRSRIHLDRHLPQTGRVNGFARFISDMSEEALISRPIVYGTSLLGCEYYTQAEALVQILTLRPQACIAGYIPPSKEESLYTTQRLFRPIEKVPGTAFVNDRTYNSIEDADFKPKRLSPTAITSQWRDVSGALGVKFNRETLQVLEMPEGWVSSHSYPQPSPISLTEQADKLFSKRAKYQGAINEARIEPMDLLGDWRLRYRFQAYAMPEVFTLDEFMIECKLDSISMLQRNSLVWLLNKRVSAADLIETSRGLDPRASQGEISKRLKSLKEAEHAV